MQTDCYSVLVENSPDINGQNFQNMEMKPHSKRIEKRTSRSKDGRIRLLKVKLHPKIMIEYEM